MKKILLYFFIVSTQLSCSEANVGDTNSKDGSSQIGDSLLFKPVYSSEFIPGKQSDNAVVLKVFKAWENNDMKVIRAILPIRLWVRISYKEIDSYKNGRIDSIELQDDNLMKNGKIEKVYSHMRKLGPEHLQTTSFSI